MRIKSIISALLIFGLRIGFQVSAVFASANSDTTKNSAESKDGLKQSFETQVSLAKAKIAILKAHSELRINKNKDASIRFLDETLDHLEDAYKNADQITRNRISELEKQVNSAKKMVHGKGKEADAKLSNLSVKIETPMNSAMADAYARTAALKKDVSVRLALTQAKAAQLKAKIALEVEQSPQKAEQALNEAGNYLAEAKAGASQRSSQEIAELQNKTKKAKEALAGNKKEAGEKLDTLIGQTGKQIHTYKTDIKESEEVALLRKRYAQIQAQAALLQAQLAEQSKSTYEQANTYLDEAKVWYERSKEHGGKTIDKTMTTMEKRISEAQRMLKQKNKDVRHKLSELLIQAAEIIK